MKKNISNLLKKLWNQQNLTIQESTGLMKEMIHGDISDVLKSAILSSLHHKGETVEEIYGFAKTLRSISHLKISNKPKIIFDTCGTGGDAKGTFNISTITSIILSAMGITVAKHGNRSITSSCGSADLLESIGVNISIPPNQITSSLLQKNIAFFFAPLFHSAMKEFSNVRKELGLRTIFNILGPLVNPVQASHQLLGVFDQSLTEKMAKVLIKLGVKAGMVVYGMDGLDEITLTTKTKITQFSGKKMKTFFFNPERHNVDLCSLKSLQTKSIEENKKIALEILSGKLANKKSPKNNIIVLNVAACLLICDKEKNWQQAIKTSREFIASGKALQKLEEWRF